MLDAEIGVKAEEFAARNRVLSGIRACFEVLDNGEILHGLGLSTVSRCLMVLRCSTVLSGVPRPTRGGSARGNKGLTRADKSRTGVLRWEGAIANDD